MAKPRTSDRLEGNLIAFPRTDLRASLGAAMKRHRLPKAWVRPWCARRAISPTLVPMPP